MAEILPFIGTRYNSQLIGNLSKVLAPPCDLISPELQADLYARHENNVVRLELTLEDPVDDGFSNKYTRAANALKTWRSDGILIEEEKPALYLYEQEFKTGTGEKKKRRGFFALVKLDDASRPNAVQQDLSARPGADRLKLLRATKSNLSPVLALYKDPKSEVLALVSKQISSEKPWEEATDEEGVVHRMWVVHKKEFIMTIREALKDRAVFLADGLPRYESAIRFRAEMRRATGRADGKQPFDYMMMFLANLEQDGLTTQPVHRAFTRQFMKEVNFPEALEELEENFEVQQAKTDLTKVPAETEKILVKLRKLGEKSPAFALILPTGATYFLKLKPDADTTELIDDEAIPEELKRLNVTILHQYIINQVMVGNPEFELEDDDCAFHRDATRVLSLLADKKAGLGILLPPTPLDSILEIIAKGIPLPHHSTYFSPKLVSGLVVRNMECEAKKPAKR